MTDYTKLAVALRDTDFGDSCDYCEHSDMCKDDDCIILQAAAAIEALQAEVERLKECNEELREKQTFIDHYGDKWMTSAKDVPTSAYNHGYMDGKNEAEQALEPKRGEWIEAPTAWKCSVCEAESPHTYPICPYCGSIMRTSLIDADALVSEIQKRRKTAKTLTGVDMVMLVNSATTIVPATERSEA